MRTRRWFRRLGIAAAAMPLAIGAGLLSPPAAAAGGNGLSVDAAQSSMAFGDTVTVSVTWQSSTPVSGIAASVEFDPAHLTLMSAQVDAAWSGPNAVVLGGPTSATIDTANKTGHLSAVGAVLLPPASIAAGSGKTFLTLTFRVVACGPTDVSLPVGKTDGGLLNGAKASYGKSLALTTSRLSVAVPCPPNMTPAPKSTFTSGSSPSAPGAAPLTCTINVAFDGDRSFASIFDHITKTWPSTCINVLTQSTDQALAGMAAGWVNAAGADRLLTQAPYLGTNHAWRIGSNGPTLLYVALPRVDFTVFANYMNPSITRAEDLVNYLLSADGQAAVTQAGLLAVGAASTQPIPDLDVDLNGSIGLTDIGAVNNQWNATGPEGWIRPDIDNNGGVGLSDIGQITGHWGQTGVSAPGDSVTLGPTADCYGSLGNYFGWKDVDSSDSSIAAVTGAFWANSTVLKLCTSFQQGTWLNSGAAAWSSLSGTDNNGEIVQIGLMRCQGIAAPGMTCDGQIRVAWAWGDCTGGWNCGGANNIGPTPEDLGVWDGGVHQYAVVHVPGANPYTEVRLDGANPTGFALADTAIPWINNTVVRGSWFCEAWNLGDDCGGTAPAPFYVNSPQYQPNPGAGWQSNAITAGPCEISAYPDYCQAASSAALYFWSKQ